MFGAGSCMTRWWNSGRCVFWASLVKNQHFAKPAIRVDWRSSFSWSWVSVRINPGRTLKRKCSDSCMTWFSNSDRCFSATSRHPYCHWSRPHCTVMFCKKENTCLSCRLLLTYYCLACRSQAGVCSASNGKWESLVTGHAHNVLQKGKYSIIHFWLDQVTQRYIPTSIEDNRPWRIWLRR